MYGAQILFNENINPIDQSSLFNQDQNQASLIQQDENCEQKQIQQRIFENKENYRKDNRKNEIKKILNQKRIIQQVKTQNIPQNYQDFTNFSNQKFNEAITFFTSNTPTINYDQDLINILQTLIDLSNFHENQFQFYELNETDTYFNFDLIFSDQFSYKWLEFIMQNHLQAPQIILMHSLNFITLALYHTQTDQKQLYCSQLQQSFFMLYLKQLVTETQDLDLLISSQELISNLAQQNYETLLYFIQQNILQTYISKTAKQFFENCDPALKIKFIQNLANIFQNLTFCAHQNPYSPEIFAQLFSYSQIFLKFISIFNDHDFVFQILGAIDNLLCYQQDSALQLQIFQQLNLKQLIRAQLESHLTHPAAHYSSKLFQNCLLVLIKCCLQKDISLDVFLSDDQQTDPLLDLLLKFADKKKPEIYKFLDESPLTRRNFYFLISNLLTFNQIVLHFHQHKYQQILINNLQNEHLRRVVYEILFCLYNYFIEIQDHEKQLEFSNNSEFIATIKPLLKYDESPHVLLIILIFIEQILKQGAQNVKNNLTENNSFLLALENQLIPQDIENLQSHKCEQIYFISSKIIENYFNATSSANSTQQN